MPEHGPNADTGRAVSRRTVLGTAAAVTATAVTSSVAAAAEAETRTPKVPVRPAWSRGAPADPAFQLWFDQPATDWQDQALPIGNGTLGGMVFGGLATEQVQLNEHSLWTGGPGSTEGGHSYTSGNWDPARPNALAAARGLVSAQGQADPTEVMNLLGQPKWGYGAYQTFGDIMITVADPPDPSLVTDYARTLNMATGISRITYSVERFQDGRQIPSIDYTREYFVSYPDKVLVANLTAQKSGFQSFTIAIQVPDNRTFDCTASNGRITMRGALTDNGLVYEGQLQVVATGGTVTDGADGSVTVANADTVMLVMSMGTNYLNSHPTYRGEDPSAAVTEAVNAAAAKSYTTLQATHIIDHGALFNRVYVDLGQTTPTKPTDQMLDDFKAARDADATAAPDPLLETVHFYLGRYLLISSSREGSLPANLQGLWNNSTSPDWQSDYTSNINLEMNYWPSDVTNLSDTVAPLVDFVDSIREPGRVTATQLCGAKGFAAMNHLNIYGFTGVAPNPSEWSPESTGWLLHQLWEHYLFTNDVDYLRTRAYPIMKEHSQFWIDYLVQDPKDGTLMVTPSFSPEHGQFTEADSYAQMIVWDLLTNTIAASKGLGTDKVFRRKAAKVLGMLDPGLRVGSWGQLQEWKADLDDPNDAHRHMSHMYGLYPSNQITPVGTPDYFAAAKTSVVTRTEHTPVNDIGWNRAQKTNLFARLGLGNSAREQQSVMLWKNTFHNFLNDWPFQIDGNFGSTSGMAEMLVQSHLGTIDILPALPDGWAKKGAFDGLRARGAHTVGASWSDGAPTEIRVTSDARSTVKIRSTLLTSAVTVSVDKGAAPQFTVSADVISFPTRAGRTYSVRAAQ